MTRTRNTTIRCVVISLIALAQAPAVDAKEIEDREWLIATTDNLTIYSLMSIRKTQALARKLEIFRQVTILFTGLDLANSPVPTEFFAVDGFFSPRDLDLKFGSSGSFHSDIRKTHIVINDVLHDDEIEYVWHGVVHFLLNNARKEGVPFWIVEGMAQYLTTLRIERKAVVVGHAPDSILYAFGDVADRSGVIVYRADDERLNSMNWIDLDLIVSRNGVDDWGEKGDRRFFAESWALMQYLRNRPDAEAVFNQQLVDYVDRIDAGGDPVQSFEDAFGIAVASLNSELPAYFDTGRVPGIRLSKQEFLDDINLDVSLMSREEISLVLGEFALSQGVYDKAANWFDIAAQDASLAQRAAAGSGNVLLAQGDLQGAAASFEQALAHAADNPQLHIDTARYWLARASATESQPSRDEMLDTAREHVIQAQQQNPLLPEAFLTYGKILLQAKRELGHAVVLLEQARRLLPADIETLQVLAEAYRAAGRIDDADRAAELAEQKIAAEKLMLRNHTIFDDPRNYASD